MDRIPYIRLRGNCPCAECVDELTGVRRFGEAQVKPGLDLTSFHPVGNYAILLKWSDSHETGIFTWPHLKRLAEAQV